MAKMLGIQAIEMYVGMIKNDFDPIISGLKARSSGIKDEVEKQVKIDLGIYDLYEERAVLDVRLKEIADKLRDFEIKTYNTDTKYESVIDAETRKRVDELNGPLLETTKVRDDLIRQVKLSGVGDDVKHVFDGLPKVLESLDNKFGGLPALTLKDVKKLFAPKKVGGKK